MAKKSIHVVPHPEGWATRREGATRVGRVTQTKDEALLLGRQQAQRNRTELVIHDRKGVIRDSDSYGNDPCPPRDKKH
jgi:hypothetical protein